MRQLLKTIFMNNFRNKTTALVLAIIIWLVVSFQVSDKYVRNDVTVEIVPLRDGLAMTDIAVEPSHLVVKATFVAPQRIGQQYLAPAAKVRAVHKMENPPIGIPIAIKLNREDFDLPFDVELTEVKPKRLEVVLRRIIARKLRVKVELHGRPAQGYELARDPQVEPTEVTVRGPKETLDVATYIPTEPVDIEGRSSSFSSDYSLAANIKGSLVETTTKVRVRVSIRPSEIVKSFSIPVRVNTPPGYEHEALLPRAGKDGAVELSVRGPKLLLNEPGTAKMLSAFVIVTAEMSPRKGIPYSAKVHLLVPPELAEIKLAGEHYVELEIREKEKPVSKKEGP